MFRKGCQIQRAQKKFVSEIMGILSCFLNHEDAAQEQRRDLVVSPHDEGAKQDAFVSFSCDYPSNLIFIFYTRHTRSFL
jgi:hypothetical protein